MVKLKVTSIYKSRKNKKVPEVNQIQFLKIWHLWVAQKSFLLNNQSNRVQLDITAKYQLKKEVWEAVKEVKLNTHSVQKVSSNISNLILKEDSITSKINSNSLIWDAKYMEAHKSSSKRMSIC